LTKRKKILFLSSWYPTPANPTHGIFVQRHARAVSLHNDVLVLHISASVNSDEEFEVCESPFQEVLLGYEKPPIHKISKYLFLKRQYENAFLQLQKKWGLPDIVHLNVVFPLAPIALSVCKKWNIPLVVTEHWTGYLADDGNYKGLIQKYLTKKTIRFARAVLPVTRHLENEMKRHGLSGKYFPIPNVVDTDFFHPVESVQKSETVFLHLSSLDERQKNPRSIIQAFQLLNAEHQHTRLVMAGDGENIYELEKFAEQLGLNGKVDFFYRPQKEKLLQLIQYCDVMVLNSNFENLPVVLLEALCCGKPVISSNVGGISEYINTDNGILFSPPGFHELHKAMSVFLLQRNNFDSKKIRQFAIENFSMQIVSEKINRIYNTLS
jgi:glycosyltransferase involved in cell wall biosynthesis